MSDGPDVEALLEERPEFEPALADVLAVDDDLDTWEFDDVPVDSGTFGELVGRGVVEKAEGRYRLADPAAVRAALDGEGSVTDADRPGMASVPSVDGTSLPAIDGASLPAIGGASLPAIDRTAAGGFLGAMVVVFLVRIVSLPQVFTHGHVVLTGNDPYSYRFAVEEAIRTSGRLFDASAPQISDAGEPLFVFSLTVISRLLGGLDAVGGVMAWYPVVSGLLVAALLYLVAMEVTEDRRVALASVVLLATVPGHALRTSLGFADHHAFDFVWLLVTATAIVGLATVQRREDLARPRTWGLSAAVGVGIGFQVLGWEAGPLLVVPAVGVVAFDVLLAVREDRSPVVSALPVVAGIGLGAAITSLGHATLGWHRTLVAVAPVGAFLGAAGLVALGELGRRTGRSARQLLVGEVLLGVGSVALFRFGAPEMWGQVAELVDRLLFGFGGIAEGFALFSTKSFGFLFLFGFVLFLALPFLVWAGAAAVSGERRWLAPCTYGGWLFVLSLFQVRFVGEFAPFAALFAGVGFVWVAAWVDLTDPAPAIGFPAAAGPDETGGGRPLSDGDGGEPTTLSLPTTRTLTSWVLLFLLINSLGLVQSPIKISQVTKSDEKIDATFAMAEYADERGWDSYEESYVYARRGDVRLYNYFVNGQSSNYGVAREGEYPYSEFVAYPTPGGQDDDWWRQYGDRVGFVVTSSDFGSPRQTMQERLHTHHGSRYDGMAALGHYRLVYASDGGNVKVFTIVPGANVTGRTEPNATVELTVETSVSGTEFTYTTRTRANATGTYTAVVPYPGEYTVSGAETTTVRVTEAAVRNGTAVRVG